jgi:hypothetical protein
MKFEYHAFRVEPYLQRGVQPVFALPEMEPAATYYTLTDPGTGACSVTTNSSDAVRIPVFALSTAAPPDLSQLTHGSLLTTVGLEVAIRLLSQLRLQDAITRVIVILATNCHHLAGDRYRTYFGISIETRK